MKVLIKDWNLYILVKGNVYLSYFDILEKESRGSKDKFINYIVIVIFKVRLDQLNEFDSTMTGPVWKEKREEMEPTEGVCRTWLQRSIIERMHSNSATAISSGRAMLLWLTGQNRGSTGSRQACLFQLKSLIDLSCQNMVQLTFQASG